MGIWAGLHAQVAALTGYPQIDIGEQTAAAWLKCAGAVARHYPVDASQKVADWMAFTLVSGMIYVPMLASIRAQRLGLVPPPQPVQQPQPVAPHFQFHAPPTASMAQPMGDTLQ